MHGAMFLAFGAMSGALGAHALDGVLTPDRLDSWATASLYMMVMGASLMGAQGGTIHMLLSGRCGWSLLAPCFFQAASWHSSCWPRLTWLPG